MFARFFIDRPIFATVLAIVTVICGGVALLVLPTALYPEVVPPTVEVSAIYPGASAMVLADTVATPIEQEVNGVENMLYMSSRSTSDGQYTLTVTFKLGTDIDIAQVLVQNRVAIAMPKLPDVVKTQGVTTKKKSPSMIMMVNLISPDGQFDQLFLSNYATIQVKDALARLDGVGDVTFAGGRDYSMRLWLNPNQLAARNMTAMDVVSAVQEQNVQVAAGKLGQPPVPAGVSFQYTVTTQGRLTDPEQFGQIILKTGDNGEVTRLRDVARVELAARNADMGCDLDGKPCVGLMVYQLPGSNALAVAKNVRAEMDKLKAQFPAGLDYVIYYDTTDYVRKSIETVIDTLFEAILLVVIVVLVFLQNWRSTLIPLLAIPVSLIGTFAVMALLGFSLNNLSLFGLVLAIGIVVDDAIVVVENVERWIEHGLTPKEASYKAMEEVTVAVVAIAFGLSAVFIPTAFISGISGQFYRQFALTISVATLLSAFNSLTLSPAMAAILLKPHGARRDILTWILDITLGWFFKGFNKTFSVATTAYGHMVGGCLRVSLIALLIYFGLLGLTYFGFKITPTGFVPSQDQGYVMISAQLPDAASLERSTEVAARLTNAALKTPGVGHTISLPGYSLLNSNSLSNTVTVFVVLTPFDERKTPDLSADAICQKLRVATADVEDAVVAIFGAPPIQGLGNTGGVKLQIQDRSGAGVAALQEATQAVIDAGTAKTGRPFMFTTFRGDVPQIQADVDRVKAKAMNVPLSDIFNTLQVYLGSLYVNDITLFGRTWQVNAQADAKFRVDPESIPRLQVRNAVGDMVPLGSVLRVREVSGPAIYARYNMYPTAEINAVVPPGVSSGQAMAMIGQLCKQSLPTGFGFEWTEIALQEELAGNTALFIFPLCVLFVFLTHSAEYESWLLPLAIILIVPMSLLSALIGIHIRSMDNNIFTQIGLVVLVGLACKNAVLIVEFAKQIEERGKNRVEAAREASTLRLRPILMTSFAFILGVVPLMVGKGAGAEMRQTLGTCVFFGMLGVTFFGLFLTPVFYAVLRWFGKPFTHAHAAGAAHGPTPTPAHPDAPGQASASA